MVSSCEKKTEPFVIGHLPFLILPFALTLAL
jgi:hypothetical protein